MLRLLAFLLLLSLHGNVFAQKADSLFVKQTDLGWVISHKVAPEETVFSVARKYHVPPVMLADFNNVSLQQTLTPGKKLFIPIGAYNLLTNKPYRSGEARPAYFRVDAERNLARIAKNSGVKPRIIQQWNNLDNNSINEGQRLLVGWILYDPTSPSTQSGGVITNSGSKIQVMQELPRQSKKDTLYITGTDTVKRGIVDTVVEVSEGERLFMEQTSNEANLTEEKGSAAFFKRSGASSNGIFFAFHNLAKRGTILKVHNPGTNKTVYAKVIGPLPTTKSFYNALIGLSNDARAELEVFDEKAWVQVSY